MMFDKDTTPTPSNPTTSLPPSAKYRGAVVEDLQLPPAFCLQADAPVHRALEAAYEREFDQLPILNENRRPMGYMDIPTLKSSFEKGVIQPDDPVSQHMNHFPLASKRHPYTVITPDTPLEDLEDFFKRAGTEFALVTDQERKWVLGVATRTDLETFVKRRG